MTIVFRLLAVLMCAGFFTSGSLKVLLCLPRPPCPPVVAIDKEDRDWLELDIIYLSQKTIHSVSKTLHILGPGHPTMH